MFGAGTACIVSPVSGVLHKKDGKTEMMAIPTMEQSPCLMQRFFDAVTDNHVTLPSLHDDAGDDDGGDAVRAGGEAGLAAHRPHGGLQRHANFLHRLSPAPVELLFTSPVRRISFCPMWNRPYARVVIAPYVGHSDFVFFVFFVFLSLGRLLGRPRESEKPNRYLVIILRAVRPESLILIFGPFDSQCPRHLAGFRAFAKWPTQ